MIENLTRSPNCVLIFPKLAISFSIKLVNLVLFFARIAKVRLCTGSLLGRPFSTNEDIHWNRFWPNKNQCISLERPLKSQWPSSAFDIPLAKSVHKIIAAHQMKTLMRPSLIQAAPFFNRKLLPFRAVILIAAPCFRRDLPHTWIMRRSVTRHLLVDLKSLFLPWLSLVTCFNSGGILLIISFIALFFFTPTPNYFCCEIQCRVMLTRAEM